MLAAVDSGALDNYFPASYIREKHDMTGPKQAMGTANRSVMRSVATDHYVHSSILEQTQTYKKFIKVTLPLLSVGCLCVNSVCPNKRWKCAEHGNPRSKTKPLFPTNYLQTWYVCASKGGGSKSNQRTKSNAKCIECLQGTNTTSFDVLLRWLCGLHTKSYLDKKVLRPTSNPDGHCSHPKELKNTYKNQK